MNMKLKMLLSSKPHGNAFLASMVIAMMGITLCGVRYLGSNTGSWIYTISGTLSIVIGCAYWFLKTKAVYLHFLVIPPLLFLNLYEYSEVRPIGNIKVLSLSLVINFIILMIISSSFRNRLLMLAFVAGVGMTSLSFYYQPATPEMRNPIQFCMEHPNCLVGAGWPIPYMEDTIGLSVMGYIGIEDAISPLNYLIDVLCFTVVIYLILRLVQYNYNRR